MAEAPVKNLKKSVADPMQERTASFAHKKRPGSASEYKKSLVEKQALKRLYGLTERQFKTYVARAMESIGKGNMPDALMAGLEKRLDNVIFRAGFAKTRAMARQLVSHAYFTVNGKPVNIASFSVEKGDIIAIKPSKLKKLIFKDLGEAIKKHQAPSWLKIDEDKLQIEIVGEPNFAIANPPVEISLIFEFYSR